MSLRLDPVIEEWLRERAALDYEGNISHAVTGLVMYDRGVAKAKQEIGETHHHYITPGIADNPELLASAIKEIESRDPGFDAKTWLERIFDQQKAK